MDPISIAPLVISAWNLLAPYAKKVADKFVEKAGESLPDAVGKVWDAVKGKMEERPETSTLPAELAATPDDQIAQGAFQYQLKKLLENDEAFAQQLEKLVNEAKQVTSYSAILNSDVTIAQGTGAVAAGERGVVVGGNVQDSTIVTGDENVVGNRNIAQTIRAKGRSTIKNVNQATNRKGHDEEKDT